MKTGKRPCQTPTERPTAFSRSLEMLWLALPQALILGLILLTTKPAKARDVPARDPILVVDRSAEAEEPVRPQNVDVSKIYGKIQFVDAFPDYKVQVVDSFPDLKVQKVNAFPDAAGKWQIVDAFPDYKIQIVTAFPDFKVKYVDAFPGTD